MINLLRKKCACHFKVGFKFCRQFGSQTGDWIPDLDFKFLCDPSNLNEIKHNIRRRKGVGDIDKVIELYKAWESSSDQEQKNSLRRQLVVAALKIPNKSHPDLQLLKEEPIVVKTIGDERVPPQEVEQFHEIASRLNVCRTEQISNFTGPKSYYFMDDLSNLEQGLIRYSLSYLRKKKFKLISVPDILPRYVIESCGMDTKGERSQVYSLDDNHLGDLCLSGTAEIGIAYYLSKKPIEISELPLKITAVSRCFRAEAAKIAEEKGVYRVHQFTKVEMFGACLPSQSENLLKEFVEIQEDMFDSLGLKLRTLDMPPPELGPQALRKYDVEAWLPGRQMWGEISSASNCTDYQSRRLGIKTKEGYVHTINGTACAAPRLILALTETHKKSNGAVELPLAISKYLDSNILRKSRVPNLVPFKTRAKFA